MSRISQFSYCHLKKVNFITMHFFKAFVRLKQFCSQDDITALQWRRPSYFHPRLPKFLQKYFIQIFCFVSFILGFVCLKETLQDAAEVIQCPSFKFQLGQWGNSEALTNSAIGNSKAAAIIQRKKIHQNKSGSTDRDLRGNYWHYISVE